MKNHCILLLSLTAAMSTTAQAQDMRRQAGIVGGGDRDHGKCSVEVRVDGIAEVDSWDERYLKDNFRPTRTMAPV